MTPGKILVGGNYAHSGSSSTYVTLGRLPDWPAPVPERVLTCSHPALPSCVPGPLHGAVERHGRRSGGLAGTFTPMPGSSEILITVPVVAPALSSAHVPGLAPEFAEVVLQSLEKLAPSPLLARLGAGHLDVHAAWWHQVDSGARGFSDLPAKLLGVLTMPPAASGEDIWNCWRIQDEALELAPMLQWLSATVLRSPEIALFGPGASTAALATLEVNLRFPLPELLRRLLLCVNGGRLADPARAPHGSTTPPRLHLLTAEEIAPAYFALAAAQHPHKKVPLSTPDRPLYRLPDTETLVPWPFLPIARDRDSEALHVLEVLPVPYSNRVQLATPHTPWSEWPVMYPRIIDFLEGFLTVGR